MEILLNSYSLLLIGFSLVTVLLAMVMYTRLGVSAKWFAACMAVIAIWAAGYGLSLAQDTLGEMLFWINVEYLGVVLVPTIWFVFVLKFTGRDCKLNTSILAGLFGFASLSLLMVWTNPLHHLHYAEYQLMQAETYAWLQFTAGPWYYVHVTYFYVLIASGIYVLIRSLKSSSGVLRQQSFIILLGTLVPWAANVLVIFKTGVFGNIDSTPFAFLFSGILVGIGLLRFRLFDLSPMARDRVINDMREGWLVLDAKHRIIDYNPRLLAIIQKERGDLVGTVFSGMAHLDQKLMNLLLDKDYEGDVDLHVMIDGKDHFYEVRCKSLRDSASYRGRLLIFRDITQYANDQSRLRLQAAELKELNEVKNRLLSIISHDVRGPLGMLTQILEMSKDGELDEKDVKDILPRLGENLNNVTGFLENLLVWAKSQFDGERIEPESFDISAEISRSLVLLKAKIKSKNLVVYFDENQKYIAHADPNMIKLVIRNLLSNAIKFCRQGDTITISISEAQNSFLKISVADTGIGILKENLSRIFSVETFSTQGTASEQGTGLGLMLSKDFVEKNKGEIWAESTYGAGSTFYFTVPIALQNREVSQYHLHSY